MTTRITAVCRVLILPLALVGCTDMRAPWFGWQAGGKVQRPTEATEVEEHDRSRMFGAAPTENDASQVASAVQEFLDRLDAPAPGGDAEAATLTATPGPTQSAPAKPGDADGLLLANVAADVDAGPAPVPSTGANNDQTTVSRPALPVITAVTVRASSADDTERALAETAPDAGANTPVDLGEDALGIQAVVDALEQHVAAAPQDLETQWRLAMLRLAAGRNDDAQEFSAELSQESSGLLSSAVRAALAAKRTAANPLAADEALRAVDELRDRLQPLAELQIPTVALCSRVTTFGVYDEMPADAFQYGRPTRTIVYCEVAHFASEPTSDRRFRTELSVRLEALTPAGDSLWRHEEPVIVDESRRRRADFFLAQLVTLPPSLPAGDYVLKVAIEDKLAGKAAEHVQPFVIHGLPQLSAAR